MYIYIYIYIYILVYYSVCMYIYIYIMPNGAGLTGTWLNGYLVLQGNMLANLI